MPIDFTKPHWQNWDEAVAGVTSPNFNNSNILWRMKPKTIRYRRYLWKRCSGEIMLGLINFPSSPQSASDTWGDQFLHWIDTEWQEVEV